MVCVVGAGGAPCRIWQIVAGVCVVALSAECHPLARTTCVTSGRTLQGLPRPAARPLAAPPSFCIHPACAVCKIPFSAHPAILHLETRLASSGRSPVLVAIAVATTVGSQPSSSPGRQVDCFLCVLLRILLRILCALFALRMCASRVESLCRRMSALSFRTSFDRALDPSMCQLPRMLFISPHWSGSRKHVSDGFSAPYSPRIVSHSQ